MSMEQTPAHGPVQAVLSAYRRIVARVEHILEGWFIGLSARVLFLAILLPYYLNSAATKVGDGFFGVFNPSAGAFAQILPPIAELYVYDTAAIPFFPWHLIVIAGTLAELILPVLIVAGLLTRLSALGMIGFVIVQTVVDMTFHGLDAGAWFDRQAGDILDQRLLWVFPLVLLVTSGPGRVSLDALAARLRPGWFR